MKLPYAIGYRVKFLFYLPSKFGDAVRDLDYPEKHPMGGSETAVLKLTQVLRALGHTAEIAIKPEECTANDVDVFVSMRDLEILLQNHEYPNRLNYLWCQDDTDQPFLQPLSDPKVADFLFSRCDAIIVPSHYAANNWAKHFQIPLSKLEMIPNAISTNLFSKIDFDEAAQRPPHAYYASTPQRGLKEFLYIWPLVIQRVPNAHLYIASSMRVYNSIEENAVKQLLEQVKALPNTTYLSSINQKELRGVAQKCRAMAYPCTFAETGCIAAMEAMASGCAVVSTAYGALPETAWRNPLVEPAAKWRELWVEELVKVFTDNAHYLSIVKNNSQLLPWMDWNLIAQNYWLQRVKSDRVARKSPQVTAT